MGIFIIRGGCESEDLINELCGNHGGIHYVKSPTIHATFGVYG